MPSKRNKAVTNALASLRNDILGGRFQPGERLTELALCDDLGISRTPLRQAFEQLISEGLLTRNESGGCLVSSFSIDDIIDAIEIRGVLEGTAVRLAAERGIDESQKFKVDQTLSQIDGILSKDDFVLGDYVVLNSELHLQLNNLCRSQVLLNEIDRVNRLPAASPDAFLIEQLKLPNFGDSVKLAQGQHKEIWNAVLSREGARAEWLAREHARLARKNLEFVLNTKPSLAKKIPGLELITQKGA